MNGLKIIHILFAGIVMIGSLALTRAMCQQYKIVDFEPIFLIWGGIMLLILGLGFLLIYLFSRWL